jgi:hypothetical protein
MGLYITDKIADKIIEWITNESPPRAFPLSDFDRLRQEIRPCDVLLIEGRSRVSEVIKLMTSSPWSHAALYIGHLYNIDNSLLRQKILQHYQGNEDDELIIESLLGEGTIVSPLSKYKPDHMRICRPKGIAYKDAQQVIAYTVGKLGAQYDVRHIFDLARFLLPWSIFPRRWRSSLFQYSANGSLRLICSTLLAEAFDSVKFPVLPLITTNEKTGIELVPRNPRLFTPSDFDYSPFFEIIKYPMIDIEHSHSLYRKLPWNIEGKYGHDDEIIYTEKVPKDKN